MLLMHTFVVHIRGSHSWFSDVIVVSFDADIKLMLTLMLLLLLLFKLSAVFCLLAHNYSM
jgi:hypothetical protein